jgi:hypothetical protein
MTVGVLVYSLCAATALACTLLLLRGYRTSGARLLLWSGLCFAFLTLNNVLTAVDLVVFPTVDLFIFRNLTALAGLVLLLYGLIWETE